MVDNATQIDNLDLDIDIELDESKPRIISSLARAITRLNKAISESSAISNLNKYVKALNNISPNNISVRNIAGNQQLANGTKNVLQSGILGTGSEVGGNLPKIATKETNEQLKQSIKLITEDTYATQRLQIAISRIEQAYNGSGKSAKEAAEAFGYTREELDKMEKKSGKTGKAWGGLLKSFGRIALYRTIRRAIQMVTQAMIEGVQNYAQYSESANQAMSGIKNSVGQLKNTFGVTLGYLIEALAPAIQALSDALVGIVNSLNMALASMNGMSGTYSKAIKQNDDYAKSLQKTNKQLLSFDKFESLQSGSESANPAEMFEESSISEDWDDTATLFKTIIDAVKLIVPILEKVWQILNDILPAVMSILAPILEIVDELLEYLLPAIESIMDVVAPIFEMIAGGLQMVGGLLKLLNGDVDGFVKNFGNGFAKMINGIVNLFIGFVNMCIDGLNTILMPLDWIIKIFGGQGVKVNHIEWRMNWQPFANGGDFNKGTAFIAGEHGAEIVSQSRNGSGVVQNTEQIRESQYLGTLQALIDYGAARGDLANLNGMGVYIDSKRAGQVLAKPVFQEGNRIGLFNT